MSTYLEDVIANKKYKGNVVIKIGASAYFSIRQPDAGLSISAPYDMAVSSLLLNPTQIDIRKVTTTISSFSFRLLDKSGIITALVLGDAASLMGQPVRIYLGRSGSGMTFGDYFELPLTYVQKCEHSDNTYNFSVSEQTERMARPIYDFSSALGVDILAATTTWTMRDDISDFPTAGFLKVEDEFVSYTGVDLANNRFTGVIRGELNSIPADHDANNDVVLVETVTGNPLDIIMQILVSGGGGGTYDVLQDGLGIDESLVDVAEIEALRDELFLTNQFTLSIYSVDSALKYMETELLAPNNLRLTNSRNSKITLAVLNKAKFVPEDDVIDEDTITKYPKWTLDGVKVTNQIEVQWDFSEGTNLYQEKTVFADAASIAAYGASTPLKFNFRGIKAALDGSLLVNDFGTALLARLSVPTPEIQITTQMNKSLQNVGDKSYLVSSKIPNVDGTLNFDSNLEIISRSINHTSGDVQFKLAFTSFTTMRSGFIAPSDLITSFTSQKIVNVALGRSAYYLVGWYMRLWDEVNQVYCADAPNKIVAAALGDTGLLTEAGDQLTTEGGDDLIMEQAATEDSITFEDNWTTVLTSPNNYRIRFADYGDVIASQKRYGFISNGGADFADGKPTYRITY